jgi:hypothetical protein
VIGRSEIDPEHGHEALRLRTSYFVLDGERVFPELLLDPNGFVASGE